MPVSPEDVELVLCDAEVLDIGNGPAKLTRTAPPKIRNFVLGRDKGRCVVPGCRNGVIKFHHEDGWQCGHDPSRCFGLCDSHHRARHKGYLKARGSMPDLRFFLADGTYLGRAGDEQKATEADLYGSCSPKGGRSVKAQAHGSSELARSSRAPANLHKAMPTSTPTPAPTPALASGEVSQAATSSAMATAEASAHGEPSLRGAPAPPFGIPLAGEDFRNPVDDAVLALKSLQLKARDAKTRVQRVLQQHPGRSWEAGDLVRAVLQGLPSPG